MKRGRKAFEEEYPEAVPLLGTMHDNDIAERFKVYPHRVASARKRLNVPHYGSLAARLRKEAEEGAQVVVLSCLLRDGVVQVLHGSEGVRVYYRGALDPRAGGPDTPHFTDMREAMGHLEAARDLGLFEPCTIPLALARRALESCTYAPVDDRRPRPAVAA